MIFDQYESARRIADELEANNFHEVARKIRDSIDTGVSGTEVFMKIRFYLNPCIYYKSIPAKLASEISYLIHNIDEALNR